MEFLGNMMFERGLQVSGDRVEAIVQVLMDRLELRKKETGKAKNIGE